MLRKKYIKTMLAVFVIILMSTLATAHQPIIVKDKLSDLLVEKPEISKAYYGQLDKHEKIFVINSKEDFTLYVNLLAPEQQINNTTLKAKIYFPDDLSEVCSEDYYGGKAVISFCQNEPKEPTYIIEGNWTPYYEEYGKDWYLKSGEFEENVPAGIYYIVVTSDSLQEKYTLAVGKKESWNPWSYVRAFFIAKYLDLWFFK